MNKLPIDRNFWQKPNRNKTHFGFGNKPPSIDNNKPVHGKKLNVKKNIRKLNTVQHKPVPLVVYPKLKATYKHSGDIGDLIYSLPVVRDTGGGLVYLNPNGLSSRKVDGTPSGFNHELIKFVQPLLEAQKYISAVNVWKGHNVIVDIDYFRKVNNKTPTLCEKILSAFGVPFSNAFYPWIECEKKELAKCVVARSFRYRNQSVNYKEVIKDYGDECVFVGLKYEHEDFEKKFGNISFYAVKNLLEMAEIINGSELFVGNQSSPMSVAIGLGKNIVQECCPGNADCVFPRANIKYLK